ncbi:MAG: quinone oxidoreductase [Polyangiaceae bacterium]
MKAIRPSQHGGAELLTLSELPTPSPGPGQLLVKVAVAGVNFIDVYQRTGLYKTELPIPLGLEGGGVVEALGTGVTTARVGERVVWSGVPGSYATHTLVPAEKAVPVPEGLDLERATAVLLQGMTAHYLAHDTFPLRPGHVALIHAAAGGTGLLLVQLAKRAGARIIGTVSTDEKAALARKAGADEIILYRSQEVEVEVRRLTQGRGVDVVYDSVGASTFQHSLKSLKPRGYLVLFGQSSGPIGTIDPQILSANGSLFLTRPTLAHYTSTRDELLARAQDLFRLIAKGELDVKIARTLPLSEARAAHEALQGRETSGKILLVP